jgi:hypothetical protein
LAGFLYKSRIRGSLAFAAGSAGKLKGGGAYGLSCRQGRPLGLDGSAAGSSAGPAGNRDVFSKFRVLFLCLILMAAFPKLNFWESSLEIRSFVEPKAESLKNCKSLRLKPVPKPCTLAQGFGTGSMLTSEYISIERRALIKTPMRRISSAAMPGWLEKQFFYSFSMF